MLNDQLPLKMTDSAVIDLTLPDADITYHPSFIPEVACTALFNTLVKHIDWRQELITLYGKTHNVPRLSCWMGDAGLDYSYSNITMRPCSWHNSLIDIKQSLETTTGHTFNSVLLNYYRNGQDSNAWHSDDEPELGDKAVIASISLGAGRDFQLRNKRDKTLRHTLFLEHGSLLLMQGNTQACWQHQIPKRANVGERINLTFRKIL